MISSPYCDVTGIEEVKAPNDSGSGIALDLVTVAVDLLSVAVLIIVVFLGSRTLRAFGQSRQAVAESASLLGIIVSSLTSRVQASESLVSDFGVRLDAFDERTSHVESVQSSLRACYLQVLRHLQDALSNDKRLILELEQMKVKLSAIQQPRIVVRSEPSREQASPLPVPSENLLANLTPTERHTLDILRSEGGKSPPELGRRMKKSREHMARLMKKLYLDGYVDRESNHPPFKYKLNDRVGSILENSEKSVTAEPPEKV